MTQPDPTPTNGPHIADMVAVDLAERKALGIRTYGVALTTFNGRDALWDLYEELLDACCYLRQLIAERDEPVDEHPPTT
jgi:hypothetical protein